MPDTSEKLGISFEVPDVGKSLKAFADLRREAAATGKEISKAFGAIAGARQKACAGNRINLPAVLSSASVTATPSSVVSTSSTGNKLYIHIRAAGFATGQGNGSIAARATGASVSTSRTRQAPAVFRPASGPRQRRDVLSAALTSGQLGGSALADTQSAVDRLDRQIAGPSNAPRLPSGPRQRLAQLDKARDYALSIGNFDAFDDAHEAHTRLSRRLRPKGNTDRLFDWLSTSRFGAAGGKLSPLIGKTMDLAPGGRNSPVAKGLLGVGILGSAAVELGKMFLNLAREGNDFATGINKFNNETGGSLKENNRIRGYAISASIGDDQAESATKALQSAITSGGMGRVIGAKLGVGNLSGPLGHQDWAADETKVLDALRREYQSDKSPNKANSLRDIRALGQESFIPAFQLSKKQFDINMQTANSGPDAATLGKANELSSALTGLGVAFDNLKSKLAGNSGLTDTVNKITQWINAAGNPGTRQNSQLTNGAKALISPAWGSVNLQSEILRRAFSPDRTKAVMKGLGAPRKGFELPGGGSISFGSASPRAEEAYRRSLEKQKTKAQQAEANLKALRSKAESGGIQDLIALAKNGGGQPGFYGNASRQGVTPRQLDTGFILNKYLNAKALRLSTF